MPGVSSIVSKDVRHLQRVGSGSSLTLVVPLPWIRALNLQPGSPLSVAILSDGSLWIRQAVGDGGGV